MEWHKLVPNEPGTNQGSAKIVQSTLVGYEGHLSIPLMHFNKASLKIFYMSSGV